MDFRRIKQLMNHENERLILLENGEPEMVVMSFAEYERLMQQIMRETEKRILIPLPEDMHDAKFPQQKLQSSEVSLEDLPIEGY